MALKRLQVDRESVKGPRQSILTTIDKTLQAALSLADGKRRLRWDGRQWVETSRSSFLTVVSRSAYSEELISLPFADAKAIKQYVYRHYSAESTLYYVANKSKNSAKVQLFKLSVIKAELCPRFGFVFPETLLISNAVSQQEMLSVKGPLSAFFLYRDNESLRSVKKIGLAKDLNQARMILGAAGDTPVTETSSGQLFNLFTKGLKKLGLVKGLAFFVNRLKTESKIDKRKLLTVIVVVSASYLALSSAYIYGVTNLRESRLQELGSDVDQVLTLQNQLRSKNDLARQLTDLRSNSQKPIELWQLVQYLAENKSVTLENLVYSGTKGQYELNVVAASLTDFYAQLTDQSFIQSASISSSVRRTRDGESAMITVKLKAGDV